MALEVIDKRYGDYKKQLHDLILVILAKEYPLKIGEICQRLKHQFNATISFQAVRKSLNAMVERRILEVKEKSYQIDKNYALEMKRLSDQTITNYFAGDKRNKSLPTQTKEAISTYDFENLIQADTFWNEVIFDWVYNLKDSDERKYYFNGPHLWYMFGHLTLEQTFLEELKSHKVEIYNLIDGDTMLDNWVSEFYSKHSKYKTNDVKIKTKTAIGVFGEYIIQYDYPEEIFRGMDEFYSQAKNLKTINMNKISSILKMKIKIKLLVMKNKAVADKVRSEILSKFDKK